MNVSYRWLRALLPELDASPAEVAETLALKGAPVEELLPLAPALEGLVVGRVVSVETHPQADRLRVCQVDSGSGTPVQVVCGAPNVRAEGCYPFAPPGSALPGGARIQRVAIRGTESDGMLCSEAELELGPDASGLLELEGDPLPGTPLAEALGLDDWRLDVEITANRGDLLSHVGVARELAKAGGGGVSLPAIPDAPDLSLSLRSGTESSSAEGVTVRVEDGDLCSRYLGAVVRGVAVGPSPEWLASRIRAAGSRPINNVVDATNYVLQEMGQPLHAFDLDKLGGSTIVVRRSRSGESLVTLDGEKRSLTSEMLSICDASDPVAIAGVMGGLESEVTGETTDVLLECALFDPSSIRATRTALEMSTEASYRFERGVDPEGMEEALRRAIQIILATAGGTPDPEVLDACPRPWTGQTVSLRPGRVKRVLGITLDEKAMEDLLAPLGFRVVGRSEDALEIRVPGFRSYDVVREVDLLEELARAYGYDRFPSDLGPFRPGTVPDHPLFGLEDEIRDHLAGEGFLEAQTMAFAPAGEGGVELSNPISVQEAFLRSSLLPGLVRRVEHNFARGQRDVRLFELGTTFQVPEAGDHPAEETRLCVIFTGSRHPMHWAGKAQDFDLWDLKGLLSRLIQAARFGALPLEEGPPTDGSGGPWLVADEAFHVRSAEGETAGFGGRVDPRKVDSPAWAGPVWGLEIRLPVEPRQRTPAVYVPLPAYPGVERDLALLLPKSLAARQVGKVIREAAGSLLSDLNIFDLYDGEGIPEGFRSVAFRLRFQSDQRTLTDDDVDQSVAAVTHRLREEFGVEPRA